METSGNKAWSAMILTTDPELRAAANESASRHGFGIQLEMSVHPANATERHLDRIRRFRPALVVLDFDDDPDAGCRLASQIVAAAPSACIVAASWSESRDVLAAAMRAGVSELVQKPVFESHLDETFARIRRRLGGRDAVDEEGWIFAFLGPKGGAGSTTVASNFAIHTGRPLVMNVPSPCSREIEGLVAKSLVMEGSEARDSEGLLSRAVGPLIPRRGASDTKKVSRSVTRLAAGKESR